MVTTQSNYNLPHYRNRGCTSLKVSGNPHCWSTCSSSSHSIKGIHNTANNNRKTCHLLELSDLFKSEVSWLLFFCFKMRYEVVQLVDLVGSLVSTFNHNTSTLRNYQFRNIHSFCWLNVYEVAFINWITFIERDTAHLTKVLAYFLNDRTMVYFNTRNYLNIWDRW